MSQCTSNALEETLAERIILQPVSAYPISRILGVAGLGA